MPANMHAGSQPFYTDVCRLLHGLTLSSERYCPNCGRRRRLQLRFSGCLVDQLCHRLRNARGRAAGRLRRGFSGSTGSRTHECHLLALGLLRGKLFLIRLRDAWLPNKAAPGARTTAPAPTHWSVSRRAIRARCSSRRRGAAAASACDAATS